MTCDLVVFNISQLVTVSGNEGLRCGQEMREVEIIENGYIVVHNGTFLEVGCGDVPKHYINDHTKMIDASGLTVTPGLIDSHTHLVHGGSREHEFEKKLSGIPYLDLLKQGGGILSTVKATREATFTELYKKATKSLNTMLLYGVTTIEAKSGYGLNLENELKQLEVAKKLNDDHPIDITSTFLGAHAVPEEYKNRKEDYIKEVLEMLPIIKERKLADYCDVFCEEGVFTIEESRHILNAAKNQGFKLKIHADEIVAQGGATLASELECVSADHLMASTDQDIENLVRNKVVANLLPQTSFNLNKTYANGRHMVDMGCGISLSTDYNPGSSPSENMQLVMQLASIKMRLHPKEVITAVTKNAACSINQEAQKGSIEKGKEADFVIFDAPNLDYLLYHFGINHVKDVFKNGKQVVKDQAICY
ncbi:imidazolonepropionase [Haloplasma contractile]|uniref:Imidazolonepropionase n=1 Tax=Haloplasma contractile SSD-17B TaxID=1033810 RepID=U2FNF3_9MOLU|nr:Imidazolonepropionase protein [Haloplasma contractile SSD-17B]